MPFLPVKIGTDDKLRRLLVSQRFIGSCIPASWTDSLSLDIRKIDPIPVDTMKSVYANAIIQTRIRLYDDKGRKAGERELNVFVSKNLNANEYGIFCDVDQFRLWSRFEISINDDGECFGNFKMRRPKFSIFSIFK